MWAPMMYVHNFKKPIPPASRIVKDRVGIDVLLYFLFLILMISFITINILLK
jgi:hypothetical protein